MTCVVLCAAIASLAGVGDRPALLRLGSDLATGVLANHTPGARRFDPPDPSRPTVVFIHGLNPMPRTVHFEMARHLGLALGRRVGPPFNVLGWEWNGVSCRSLRASVNDEAAIEQGVALAAALREAGVSPAGTHLIGHSSGCIVAASAGRAIAAGTGERVAQLTLLDPATFHHSLVFERLAAGSAAQRVENYWTAPPSGFGREVNYPGVCNMRVPGPTPWIGLVLPLHSDHLNLVHWYLETAADATRPSGFNTSLLLRGEGAVESNRFGSAPVVRRGWFRR
jgi:pimeloyl-ACP methyl ester carboxylesterase